METNEDQVLEEFGLPVSNEVALETIEKLLGNKQHQQCLVSFYTNFIVLLNIYCEIKCTSS